MLWIRASAPSKEVAQQITKIESLRKPFIKMLLDELVVLQVRICSANPIDFLALSRRKILVGIQAPSAFKQFLTAQNFMDSRNAASEIMRWIKDRGIGVGQLLREGEE